MNLTDYENDPYAPDPRASQRVAAQKRAAAQHDNPEPITPLLIRNPQRQQLIVGLVGVLAVVGVLALAIGQHGTQAPGPLAITPAATEAAQAFGNAPTASPAPATATEAPQRTVSAYAAPDGALLGQIEATRAITPVAHFGAGWIQADVEHSGLVWLRAGDVPGLAIVGPDLAPVAAVPAQTGRGLTLEPAPADSPAPEATPAPAQPTAAAAWPTSAPVVAPDFKKPDIAGTCKMIGCLGQNAIDLSRAQACHALWWQYKDADAETIPEPDYSAVRGCIWEGLYT